MSSEWLKKHNIDETRVKYVGGRRTANTNYKSYQLSNTTYTRYQLSFIVDGEKVDFRMHSRKELIDPSDGEVISQPTIRLLYESSLPLSGICKQLWIVIASNVEEAYELIQ